MQPAGANGPESEIHSLRFAGGPRCLVVMYHYVHDTEPVTCEGVKGLTSREFCVQVDRLASLLEPIDWPMLYAWTEGRGSLPEHGFLLTFDDGLADHARVVLPILQERGLRGVFFVPGAVLASQRMLPAHATHVLLSTLGVERLEHELLRYLADQGDETDWASSVDEAAARAMYHYESPPRARLKYLLTVMLPIELRILAIEMLFERHVGSVRRWAQEWYLGWNDLVELQSLGHTVGGHGFSHESYLRLTPAQRREDLHRSAVVLRGGLGADIRPFSYPYGGFDDDVGSACRETGFAHAFSTQPLWVTRGANPLCLPRFDTIYADAALEEEFACHQR